MTDKILYIEDNPLNLRLVRKYLKVLGYEMAEAVDGRQGIQKAISEQPCLLLVDVNLPDMDGLEVTRRLRKNPATAHLPIVALTANSMHGDRERCLEAGCDEYLAKPVARFELKNMLERFLTKPIVQPIS